MCVSGSVLRVFNDDDAAERLVGSGLVETLML